MLQACGNLSTLLICRDKRLNKRYQRPVHSPSLPPNTLQLSFLLYFRRAHGLPQASELDAMVKVAKSLA